MIWMREGQRRPTTSQMTVIWIVLYLPVINFLVKRGVLVFIIQLWVLMNLLLRFRFGDLIHVSKFKFLRRFSVRVGKCELVLFR